jgi:DNA-binding NarL/FixJ family response regulator
MPYSPERQTASPSAHPRRLSPRQRQVARLLTEGWTNREIAAGLVISERTAENHVQRLLNVLGMRSRVQVAVWAVQNGIGR